MHDHCTWCSGLFISIYCPSSSWSGCTDRTLPVLHIPSCSDLQSFQHSWGPLHRLPCCVMLLSVMFCALILHNTREHMSWSLRLSSSLSCLKWLCIDWQVNLSCTSYFPLSGDLCTFARDLRGLCRPLKIIVLRKFHPQKYFLDCVNNIRFNLFFKFIYIQY